MNGLTLTFWNLISCNFENKGYLLCDCFCTLCKTRFLLNALVEVMVIFLFLSLSLRMPCNLVAYPGERNTFSFTCKELQIIKQTLPLVNIHEK